MFDEQKKDLAQGLLCVLVIPALVFCAGLLLFYVGYIGLAIVGGMNTPAPRTVVNADDMPLAVGESWRQGEAFEVTVTAIRELSWTDPLLADVSAETMGDYQGQQARALDIVFSMNNLGYCGYFYDGKLREGLRMSVRAVELDEEMSPRVLLPEHGQNIFGGKDAADSAWEGLGVGQSLAENHFIVFAAPTVAHFDVTFRVTEDETLEEIEARRKAGDTTRHDYERTWRYAIE